jgi:hypothetical protein
MAEHARKYSMLTIKRLFALSGNKCAFPGCSVSFLNCEDESNLSNICHIEDANPSTHKADRYNPNMTDAERSDFKNLILLCPNHHIETNDPDKYSVNDLKDMKRVHEENMAEMLENKASISSYPSVLGIIINNIGSSLIIDEENNGVKIAPDTEDKILYNNIKRHRAIIEEYSVYQGKLNAIYEEIEKQGSHKKAILLQNIRTLYLAEKGIYGSSIDEIRQNADLIIDNINNEIWKILETSNNLDNNLPIEIINIGIKIVMVDAFMRCKILEEPIKV